MDDFRELIDKAVSILEAFTERVTMETNPTKDDGHVPCWHLLTRPIAQEHGRYIAGPPTSLPVPDVVIVCCWCGCEEPHPTETPLPATHAAP